MNLVPTGPLKGPQPARAIVQDGNAESPRLQWFGSSGIRGPLERVDATLALALGRAVGMHFKNVIVSRDARVTGPALQRALVAGLVEQGANVTDAGLLPTPGLAHAAQHYDIGIQVTASHNPAPDNGFKLWTPTGSAPSEAALLQIEADIRQPAPPLAWDQVGNLRHDESARERYMAAIINHVAPAESKPLAGVHIALDCAHGAGATTTPKILTALGADLTVLGGNPDGRFPDHPSEPTAENLARLSHLMERGDHAFGLAHDGDADRTVVLGPSGTLIPAERLFAVLAKTRGDTKLALPIDASGVVRDYLPHAEITITPVGDIYLSRAIEAGATFACEPSGPWFFGDWSPTPEGPYAAARIACEMVRNPGLLSEVDALPRYARIGHKVKLPQHVTRSKASQIIDQLAGALGSELDALEISRVDGVRFDTANGWVLLRPSGTEPMLRVTAEARAADRAEALAGAARAAFESAMGGC